MLTASGSPRPIQARAEITVTAVIEATVRAIDAGGEANVRIDDILRETKISKGSLYHHFGGREGLIAAARVEQFSRFVESEAEEIHVAFMAAKSFTEYTNVVTTLLELGECSEKQHERLRRLNTISSSYGRIELWKALAPQQHRYTEKIANAIHYGQSNGWVRSDLDPRAIAVFVQWHSLSRLLLELDTEPIELGHWQEVVRVAVATFFVPQK